MMKNRLQLMAGWTFLALLLGSAVLLDVDSYAKKDPGLQEILDGWADALGGREALAGWESLYSRFKIQMGGMEGTAEEWAMADGRHRFDMDLAGMFQMVQVYDGHQGWSRDPNGKVSRVSGDELEEQINNAYFSTWSHLIPGRLPGRIESRGTEKDTGLWIVNIRPEGGREVDFYLDPRTRLPVRLVQETGDQVVTIHFEDWKVFDGIRFPAKTRQSRGEPGHDVTFEIEEVERDRTPPRAAFGKLEESADDVRFTAGAPVRDIPIELSTDHIFLQARVNGSEPLWFILDTGASVTVLNPPVAERLGLEMKGSMRGGGAGEKSVEVRMIPGVSFQLPGVELRGQTVMAISMEAVEPKVGRPVDGVLGYDFISRFVVEIDYQDQVMHLHDREGFRYEGTGVEVPIRLVHNHPQIEATVTPYGRDPMPATFVVDSGAGLAIAFNRPFAEQHDLVATFPKKYRHTGGAGVGGQSTMTVGRIEALEIAGVEFPQPVSVISHDRKGALASSGFAGIIGGQVLARFTVWFDYERERMILEKNERFSDPFHTDMSGLSFTTGGRGDWNTFTVNQVRPGTPAGKAGIEVGDVISRIDGQPAGDFTAGALVKYLQRDGKTVRLTLDRDGRQVETRIKLKPQV